MRMFAMLLAISGMSGRALAGGQPGVRPDVVIVPGKSGVHELLVHPSVITVLHFPDAVVDLIKSHEGIHVRKKGRRVAVHPAEDLPAGTLASVAVVTESMRVSVLLRVAAGPEGVTPQVTYRGEPPALPAVGSPPGGARREGRAQRSASRSRPGAEPIRERAGPAIARDTRSSRPELSVHMVMSVTGFTAIDIAGYAPRIALRPHHTFGMRIIRARHDAWWALQADISGDWLTEPTVHVKGDTRLLVDGPRLRGGAGMTLRAGEKWISTAHVGIGVQAHLLQSEETISGIVIKVHDMRFAPVLALGMGLHYRSSSLLLGLEFQVRQGIPDDYRSIGALGTVGYILNIEEKNP